jgi:hypothetical protein
MMNEWKKIRWQKAPVWCCLFINKYINTQFRFYFITFTLPMWSWKDNPRAYSRTQNVFSNCENWEWTQNERLNEWMSKWLNEETKCLTCEGRFKTWFNPLIRRILLHLKRWW